MKPRIAEWILSQVLPPDRAASTVGDWMEDAPKRGDIWFWSSVFRTAASAIRSDFAESPGIILSLALRSCLFSWLVYVIGTIALFSAAYISILLQILHSPYAYAAFWFAGELLGWTSVIAYGVLTGRWTAHRANGKKMAACIACSIAHLILSGAIRLGSNQFLGGELKRSLASRAAHTPWIVEELIFEIGLIVGFLWLRQPERSAAQ